MQVRSYEISEKELTVNTKKRLGSGAVGCTYRGKIMLNGHEVPAAIKLLDTSKMTSEEITEAKRQIKMEQRLFELLGHADNVIKYYGHTQIKGQFAIVMQFANKGDLATVLGNAYGSKALSITNTRYLITDIANGVSQLHAKDIIHCDLKPENILVTEDNGNLHAKVADLGLSKTKSDMRGVCGTPVYLAPEVLLCNKQGKKSDIYSTALIIWETLAAPERVKDVFTASTLDELETMVVNDAGRPSIYNQFPQKVGMWIERSWSQQAKSRPTAAKLAAKFNALTDEDMKNTFETKMKTI